MKTRTGENPIRPAPSCPVCARVLDGWTSIGHLNRPKPGDFSICAYCLAALAFTEDLALRRQTDEERIDFMATPGTLSAYVALRLSRNREMDDDRQG